ncbi:MAG: RNA-binding protein [Pirellulaceae bacterium]|nr:MAG: RNA-binding protein [Pirellulaceae bacterium]
MSRMSIWGVSLIIVVAAFLLTWNSSSGWLSKRLPLFPTSPPTPPAQLPSSPSPTNGNPDQHEGARAPDSDFWFVDATREAGIDFVHTHGGSGKRYLVETICAGLALFDYDGDGLIDIYFLNGAPLDQQEIAPPPRNALYRNMGGFRFIDVTEEAGVGDSGYGLGVATADYDNDGDQDIYVNNFGPNVFYRNNGDGTFEEIAGSVELRDGNEVGAGTAFFDADRDGDLDLYVGHYVVFRYEDHRVAFVGGYPRYPSPRDYQPAPDALYLNNGDGSFRAWSHESGIAAVAGTSMGLIVSDIDDDGDDDVFVCNDVLANFLFQNRGNAQFTEIALIAGTAYNRFGSENASMGVDVGDYNRDGRLDFFMTSYQGELPVLYENRGHGQFEDVTIQTGAGDGCLPHVNWGTGFADFENDGDLDLFIACGHVDDMIELIDSSTSYNTPNVLLRNDGGQQFTNVSSNSGPGLAIALPSRGSGLDDLDNDGDIDVAILNLNTHATLLRNESPHLGNWIRIRLIGSTSNRDAVGARVTVQVGQEKYVDEVHSGRGYQSDHGRWIHFGLGAAKRVDAIHVRWPSGRTDILSGAPINRSLTIIEGTSSVATVD